MQIDYRPVPSLQRLFTESRFWNVLIGPIGSTKTTACIFYLLYRAASQKPDRTGYRRTRFVISRPTLPQLKATVLQDILHHLGPLVRWRPSENLIQLHVGDIRSDWYLVPLDTTEDQRRLLSMQLSGVWFNEGREVKFELITAAAGRVGRYPSVVDGGVSHPFVLIDSNPGIVGSELYEFCVVKPPDNLLYIHQPSALSDEADWLQYLPNGKQYYLNLMIGASEEWINVHIHGRWGRNLAGEAVFASIFHEDVHVQPTERHADWPVLVGLDPGRHPAAVIAQLSPQAVLHVQRELWSDDTSFYAFLAHKLRPLLLKEYLTAPTTIFMDPAGRARSSLSEHSPYSLCRSFGFNVRLAPTNIIDARKLAVERLLTTFDYKGRPQIIIDPSCQVLIRGMRGEYRYRRMRSGEIAAVPEKKHPVSDVMDALQYIAVSLSQRLLTPDAPIFGRPRSFSSRETGIPLEVCY